MFELKKVASRRGATQGDNPLKILMRTLMTTLLICVLAPAPVVLAQDNPSKPASAQSDAKKAFAKLKTFTGSWQGTIMGRLINITIRMTSSGNAILHEATAEGDGVPDHEITTFYVEGDRLLATHYCDAGNRSRMEGKLTPDGKSVEFSLLELAGGTQRGSVKRMVFTIIDENHHTVELIYLLPDGKQVQPHGEFQRTK
jgi:hypothetical protein